MGLTAMISAVLAIAAAVFLFTMPMAGVFMIVYSPLAAWGLSTVIVARVLTRMVVVARPDAHMVCVDEQRWWRDDELAVPDAAKREYKGRRVAFLYHVYGPATPSGGAEDGESERELTFKGLAPFNPWADPLEFKLTTASAGHVAGIKADMKTAEAYALHQKSDPKEMIRYGLMAVLIGIGLMCAYLAMGTVVDAR